MESFLYDINNKLNDSLRPVVLLERSSNILNNQSLGHEFYKKDQSSVSSRQSRPMISNQSSRFLPKNSFADRNQMLSQRCSQEQQTFQHPKLVNENQKFTRNQATRLNEMQDFTTTSQKIPELSDVSYRSRSYQTKRNFNDNTFNNHLNNQSVVNDHQFRKPYDVRDQSNVQSDLMNRFNQDNQSILCPTRPSQGVLDDHHFRRPYDVRGQFDVPSGLVNRFNQIQDVNQLSDPNLQYNIVGSTVADQLPQGSMLYRPVNMSMASYFSVPKYTLQKMNEELSTAISVVNLMNSEMGIPIEDLEIHVMTFLIKLKKQMKKLIVNSPSSSASLASLNMSMENVQYIQRWLGSSMGLHGKSNNLSTCQQQSQPLALNMSNFNQPQQMTETNRTQQRFAQQPRGNGQNELYPLRESDLCEQNHEDVDISTFNSTSRARLRDQSMLKSSTVTTTSTRKQATTSKPKRMAKQVTIRKEPAPVSVKNKLEKETLPINSSFQVSSRGRIITPRISYSEEKEKLPINSSFKVSSRGRIITPKISYCEANKEIDVRSTAKAKINNHPEKRNTNPTASNLSVPSPVVKKQLGLKTTKALMNESKQTTNSSKTTNENDKPAFVEKQNTKKDAEKEVTPTKENLPVDEDRVVEKVPAIESENPAALNGKKRKNNQDVPVQSKKRKPSENNFTRNSTNEFLQSSDTSGGSCFEHSSSSSNTSNIDRKMPPRTRSSLSQENTTKSPSFMTGEEHNAAVRNYILDREINVITASNIKHFQLKPVKVVLTRDPIVENLLSKLLQAQGKVE